MARYYDVHPHDPQPRSIAQIVAMLRDDALVAYPTDSGYALGCQLDSRTGPDRIRRIRHLDDKHDFTLVCADFQCSANVRTRPSVAYVGFDVEAAKAERIAMLRAKTTGFVREVLGEG